MQRGVLLVVRGVDVGTLVLPLVQLGAGPLQDDLEALGSLLLVLVRPGDARAQRPLRREDLRPHAQQVESRLVVHVALVGVAVLAEEKGPVGIRRGRGRGGLFKKQPKKTQHITT